MASNNNELMVVSQQQQPPAQGGCTRKAPTSLAPGFRFHPTDEELVRYYLWRKVCGKPFRFQAVSDIDVYKSEPWELADHSLLNSRDQEWYFFVAVDKKYGNGSRLNRATGRGYWKATGKDRFVRHKAETIGSKKTLVFHSGRAPEGKRTDWVMHEYRLSEHELGRAGVVQGAFVLCRIFQKSGLGPPNADRYAPFLEEEWEDDGAHFVPGGEAEDDMTNSDGSRDKSQVDTQLTPFGCKRERSEDQDSKSDPELETFSLFGKKSKQSDPNSSNANGSEDSTTTFSLFGKKSKQSDPNSSNANGSEDSTTTSHDPGATNMSSALVEYPLLDSIEAKESQALTISTSFNASTLENAVPPGYLNFINNLESELVNASMEKETLKIEVMRAQAMINILQSRIDQLTEENSGLRKGS